MSRSDQAYIGQIFHSPEMPMASGEAEIEIRQIFEADDFGADYTPELRAQQQRQRAEIAAGQ